MVPIHHCCCFKQYMYCYCLDMHWVDFKAVSTIPEYSLTFLLYCQCFPFVGLTSLRRLDNDDFVNRPLHNLIFHFVALSWVWRKLTSANYNQNNHCLAYSYLYLTAGWPWLNVAMELALSLEKLTNEKLLNLHQVSIATGLFILMLFSPYLVSFFSYFFNRHL